MFQYLCQTLDKHCMKIKSIFRYQYLFSNNQSNTFKNNILYEQKESRYCKCSKCEINNSKVQCNFHRIKSTLSKVKLFYKNIACKISLKIFFVLFCFLYKLRMAIDNQPGREKVKELKLLNVADRHRQSKNSQKLEILDFLYIVKFFSFVLNER